MPQHGRFRVLSRGLNRKRGEMNRTESKYADALEAQRLAGDVAQWWFEPFSLRLSAPAAGQPARYSPDFLVLMPDGTTFVDDVKTTSGFDDKAGVVRIKVAAELFPLWRFRIVRQRRVRDGGGYDVTEV